ncbi:UDP:flavonoid glycosyltransferase YjiC (YdhE family) [Streptomyces puniciscabiei]|uniref:UDP:flavonoid glycosyltransferase YjiC (YdhE family) n=1 Tax=Streptomyces puniciscabiei TaxID=164348 RepID=A0A542SYI0_9ACTN|nr:glycosyltransferase [Streptomyces puniciscabiei]TQK79367.1 UDP:flavonoid glycosyltransferase YjiC (YdhE family) [Streptomyces puniciscabiei]
MTAGSRGDAAPYTGLGHRLVRAGHEVTLVTHARFAPLVAGSGVRFHALPVDPRAELESPRGRALHRSAGGAGKLLRVVDLARRLVGRMTEDLLTAARDAEVLLLSSSLAPLGHAIGEGLRVPSMGVYLQPLTATREFAPPVLGGGHWGGTVNRLAGHGVGLAVEHVFAATVPGVRARLGLPPLRTGTARRARERRDWPVHHGFSPLVVPRPRDWRAGLTVSGYWWPYDTEEQLPDHVSEFLDAGPAPVFVGLGSATVPDAARLSAQVVAALRRAGLRGVIQRGWGGLAATGDDMLTVDDVPHALLFPRMAAVVHHAGAGTTAAGLRAGVPAVPVPVQFDAGFWSARLVALGVAPAVVPLRRLTVDTLAPALVRATREPVYRDRARRLGARIRDEDGTAPVLAALDRLGG